MALKYHWMCMDIQSTPEVNSSGLVVSPLQLIRMAMEKVYEILQSRSTTQLITDHAMDILGAMRYIQEIKMGIFRRIMYDPSPYRKQYNALTDEHVTNRAQVIETVIKIDKLIIYAAEVIERKQLGSDQKDFCMQKLIACLRTAGLSEEMQEKLRNLLDSTRTRAAPGSPFTAMEWVRFVSAHFDINTH